MQKERTEKQTGKEQFREVTYMVDQRPREQRIYRGGAD